MDDSWCAIRWAGGSSKPPWSMVDEVEEVIELATKLNVCFVHVL